MTNDSPTHEAEAVVHAFFDALRTGNRSGALGWCETGWRNDPERSPALRETLDSAPPVSWTFREVSVPHDWDERAPLPWIQVEAVVTYEADGGRFEGVPARLWVADTRFGWKVWNIVWWPDGQQQPVDATDEARQVIPCTRCPQQLRIPVGIGRLRVKCPECWTVQIVDS
jgi:hypothetical protein